MSPSSNHLLAHCQDNHKNKKRVSLPLESLTNGHSDLASHVPSLYLHGSPVVGKEGYCISQISKMFHSCAVSIVLRLVAAGYVITCQVL